MMGSNLYFCDVKLTNREQEHLSLDVARDFSVDVSFSKSGLPREKRHGFRRSVAFSVANGRTFQRKDPYFELLKTQLDPSEQGALKEYLHEHPMVIVRRTRPNKEFVAAVNEHAAAIGTTSLTRLQLIEQRPDRRGNGHKDILDQENKIAQESKAIAQKSIRFYSVDKDPGIGEITKKLNEISDKFEYQYEVLLTEKIIRNKDNGTSSFILISAGGLERLLDKTATIIGDYGSRLVSQVWGEAIVLLVQEGRNVGIFAKKGINFLRKRFIDKKKNEEAPGKKSERAKKQKHPILNVAAPLAITTLTSALLSKGTRMLYGIIPLLNTGIITAFEFGKKVRALHESLGSIELTKEQRNYLLPPALRLVRDTFPVTQKVIDAIDPAYLIAYSDLLSSGKIARATLIGSALATLFVIGAALFAPITIPSAVLYTLAGVAIENLWTLGYGMVHQMKDIYKGEFVSYVKRQLKEPGS